MSREESIREPVLPNRLYYQACVGRWRSPLELVITDWPAFRRAPMSGLDRLRVLSIALWPRWLGPLWFETTVEGAPGEVFIHTTRVSKWGLTFLSGREVLTLDRNGRDVAMSGEQRLAPTLWSVRRFEGRASIDESATRATYVFPSLGTEMRQSTLRETDVVTITQETAWWRGVQRLERQE